MSNEKTSEQRKEMIAGFLYDIQSVENRIASELTKIVAQANGSIDLNNPNFKGLKASFMESLFKEPEPGKPAISVTSFAETSKTIKQKLAKTSNGFSQEQQASIESILNTKKKALTNNLVTEAGIQSIIAEDLKRDAIKNLQLIDDTNKIYNTPADRASLEQLIGKHLSFPLEITNLLAMSNPKFASDTLKNIIQNQISNKFSSNTKKSPYKISLKNLDSIAIQKEFADAVNDDINQFVRKGLVDKIIHDAVPDKSKDGKKIIVESEKAAVAFAKLTETAKIPLAMLSDQMFKTALREKLQDKRFKGNISKLDPMALSSVATHVGLIQQHLHLHSKQQEPDHANTFLATIKVKINNMPVEKKDAYCNLALALLGSQPPVDRTRDVQNLVLDLAAYNESNGRKGDAGHIKSRLQKLVLDCETNLKPAQLKIFQTTTQTAIKVLNPQKIEQNIISPVQSTNTPKSWAQKILNFAVAPKKDKPFEPILPIIKTNTTGMSMGK
jgi:hypothetical protein